MENRKRRILVLCILAIFLISFINLGNIESFNKDTDFGLKLSSNGDLTTESLTVNEYDQLNEGHSYTFSGTVYDSNDYGLDFTNAYLETEYLSASGISFNDSISVVDNSDQLSPSSFTYINGSEDDTGTLDVLDNDYYAISSTETGHYPATYSFIDDADDSIPVGWSTTSMVDPFGWNYGRCRVWSDHYGHRKVLRFTDFYHSYSMSARQVWDSPQENGSIEFWLFSEDMTNYFYIRLEDDSLNDVVSLVFHNDNLYYIDNTVEYYIDSFSDNTWYHFRIDFETSNNGYLNLTENMFSISIDGVDKGIYDFDVIGIPARMDFRTPVSGWVYGCFLDAVQYSWDTENSLTDGYYWNYYLGSETFEEYNTTYNDVHYDGTYDFNNISIGTTGTDIDFVDGIGAGYTAEIISSSNGHKKVIRSTRSGNFGDFPYNTISQTSGTVEFWFWGDAIGSDVSQFVIWGDGVDNYLVIVDYLTSNTVRLYYGDGVGGYISDDTTVSGWAHVKLEFDMGTDTFSAWVDGTNKLTDVPFYQDNTGTTAIKIGLSQSSGITGYYDAISYDWDTDYELGDNINKYGIDVIHALEDNNWDIANQVDTSIGISAEFNKHRRVLNLYDNNGAGGVITAIQDFSSQTYGTIEYWLKTDNALFRTPLLIRNSDVGILGINIDDDVFKYTNNVGVWTSTGLTALDNTWYHISIDFELSGGNYEGLTQYYFQFYIDGVKYGEYECYNHFANVDNIRIYTNGDDNNYNQYYDAFGYSWEFPIGTNLLGMYDPELNITCEVDFSEFTSILQTDIYAYYKTNIIQTVNFSVWDFTNSEWILINSSMNNNSFYPSYVNYNTTIPRDDVINGSGSVILNFYAYNLTTDINLYLDYIYVKNLKKLDLTIDKTFNFDGFWKYRFHCIASDHYTDWVNFEVIEQIPNIEIISESTYYTKWDFIDDNNPTTYLYNPTFDGSSGWSLYNVPIQSFSFNKTVSGDSWTNQSATSTNYGNSASLISDLLYFDITKQSYIFLENDLTDYLYDNITANTILYMYAYQWFHTGGFWEMDWNLYKTYDFDEDTITWGNMPSRITPRVVFRYLTPTVPLWIDFNLGNLAYEYYRIEGWGDAWSIATYFYSKENSISDIYDPYLRYSIGKIYDGNNELYCQTNEIETLTLRSPTLSLNLELGDVVSIDYQTTSDNRIDFNWYNGINQTESYVISRQGNSDFTTRTIDYIITEDTNITQFEFMGIFDDTTNLKINSIQVSRRDANYTEYLEPYGRKDFAFTYPFNITVNVYENNLRVETFTVSLSADLQTLIYTRTDSPPIYFTYYDANNEYLEFNLFTTYANYTYDGNDLENERLSSNIVYVDRDTIISITIYDSFTTLVKTYETDHQTFVDVILDVYSLKIKNEAEESVEYDLSKSGSSVIKSGNIFSEEIIDFRIALGSYSLDYINHEDDYPRTLDFTLADHQLITINTTYHQIYFSMFTYDGLGVDHDLVRFYINDERKDFGFNTIQSETAHLIILDFFNNTLANETIDASYYSEYNLFVEIYSLIVLNQFTYEDIVVNITQVGSGVWMTQIIPKQFGLTYRFLPNIEYNITIFFTNATLYTSRIVNLTENSHIESFGVPTTAGLPEYPKDVYFSVYTGTGLAIQQQLVKFYIDGDRADFGFNTIEDEIISVVVRDFFNTTLFSLMVNVSGIYEYDILIDIFSLKIKNEATLTANYTLTLGGLTDTGNILPQEIIEYQLSSTYYIFEYTNNEDESYGIFSVSLNQDLVFILNSTYYDVYIGLYNFYDVVNRDEVRFYINGTRSDFGFNTITTEYAQLTVLDYFNSTLFDQVVRLEGLQEYNIFIEAYTLIINNDYATQDIIIKITKGTITVERLIEAQGFTEFKLFANTEYEIKAYDLDEDKFDEETIDLDEEYKIISFGFFDEPVPIDPTPIVLSFETLVWVLVFAMISIIVFVILVFQMRDQKRKNNQNPTVEYEKKSKESSKSYDNRFILQENKNVYKPKSRSRY